MALTTIPIPKDSFCTFGNGYGNKATCVAQGFFIQLSFAVPGYNAMLCIYFLCVIKWNTSERVLAKYEPFMHAFAVLPPLVTAIIAAANNLINSFAINCWLAEEDKYSIDKADDDNEKNILLAILIGSVLVIALIIFIIIVGSMVQVYLAVKRQESRMSSYQFRPRATSAPSNSSSTQRKANRLSKDVSDTLTQAILYVCAFFFTYLFRASLSIV